MNSAMHKSIPKRAALVGLGWWGQHIARQLKGSDIVSLSHAIGSREEHRGRAEGIDVPFATDLAAVLSDPLVDFVILATPHNQHVRQIEEVARAGKHVFCEKPVALSARDVSNAIAACRMAGVSLGVGHERRFEPAVEQLRKLMTEEFFGTVVHIEASFNHDKLRGIAEDNWRVSDQGGTPLAMTATGIHLTDLFLNLIGPIENVRAFGNASRANAGFADNLSVHFEFASKATGYLSTILSTPFYSRLAIFGSEAWAEVRNATHPDEVGPSVMTTQRSGEPPLTIDLPGRDAVRANLETFALSLSGEACYPFSHGDIVGNIAVMEAVSRSIAIGQKVSIAEIMSSIET